MEGETGEEEEGGGSVSSAEPEKDGGAKGGQGRVERGNVERAGVSEVQEVQGVGGRRGSTGFGARRRLSIGAGGQRENWHLVVQPPSPPGTPPPAPAAGRGDSGGAGRAAEAQGEEGERKDDEEEGEGAPAAAGLPQIVEPAQGESQGGGVAGGTRPPIIHLRLRVQGTQPSYHLQLQRERHQQFVRRLRTRSFLWITMPHQCIMGFCSMLSLYGLNMSEEHKEDFTLYYFDKVLILLFILVYLCLRYGDILEMDPKVQILYHAYSTWIWGMAVFYCVVHTPLGLEPLAVLVMTTTGTALYSHVVLLALSDRLDGHEWEMFVVGLCVPVAIVVVCQPLYLLNMFFGLVDWDLALYVKYLETVSMGSLVATVICYERLWKAHQFINGPMHQEMAIRIEQLIQAYWQRRNIARAEVGERRI